MSISNHPYLNQFDIPSIHSKLKHGKFQEFILTCDADSFTSLKPSKAEVIDTFVKGSIRNAVWNISKSIHANNIENIACIRRKIDFLRSSDFVHRLSAMDAIPTIGDESGGILDNELFEVFPELSVTFIDEKVLIGMKIIH